MTRKKGNKPPPRKPPPKRPWDEVFLERLAAGDTVSIAAAAAGVSRQAVYHKREKDKAFAVAFENASLASAEILEAEARRRATKGVEHYQHNQGELVLVHMDAAGNPVPGWIPGPLVDGKRPLVLNPAAVAVAPLVERKYSDTLLIFLLKGRNPAVFGDKVKVENDSTPRSATEGEAAIDDLLARVRARAGIEPGRAAGGGTPDDGVPHRSRRDPRVP